MEMRKSTQARILGMLLVGMASRSFASTSDFQYPWAAGYGYDVNQGNNAIWRGGRGGSCISGGSHTAANGAQYAWDFALPLNTPVLAAKGGTAHAYVGVNSSQPCWNGGDGSCANSTLAVWIDHGDGTSATYLHLWGIQPNIDGKPVLTGQQIGVSGKSGWTYGYPHLHYQVMPTCRSWWCNSTPSSFEGGTVPTCGQSITSHNTRPGQPAHVACSTGWGGWYNCGWRSGLSGNKQNNTLYYCNGPSGAPYPTDGVPVQNCMGACTGTNTNDYCDVTFIAPSGPNTTLTTEVFINDTMYDYFRPTYSFTGSGDWQGGYFKATCPRGNVSNQPYQAMTGLSMQPYASGYAHAALCSYNDSFTYPGGNCRAVVFNASNNWPLGSADWDGGYYKGQCQANEYVAGISQSTAGNGVYSILCCAGNVAGTSCLPQVMYNQNGFETGSIYWTNGLDWDGGYWKGECAQGRYVAGVSRDPVGGFPHGILCCSP